MSVAVTRPDGRFDERTADNQASIVEWRNRRNRDGIDSRGNELKGRPRRGSQIYGSIRRIKGRLRQIHAGHGGCEDRGCAQQENRNPPKSLQRRAPKPPQSTPAGLGCQ